MGLPGCIGSTDCVHFGWDRCPAGERSQHKGKEGFPTLSQDVTVDRNKKIISCTAGHPGARNDKTIVKFDEFITKINDGNLYKDEEFQVYTDVDGTLSRTSLKGLYVACDGGYPLWPCLQCPLKHTSKDYEARWSKLLESVRKDVECTFGILKGRFRCLKLPIFYHSKKNIDNMFFTCCILHNMLLSNDGFDRRWEDGCNWQGQYGNHSNEDLTIFKKHARRTSDCISNSNTDYSNVGHLSLRKISDVEYEGVNDVAPGVVQTHKSLKSKLIYHYNKMYERGEVEWL